MNFMVLCDRQIISAVCLQRLIGLVIIICSFKLFPSKALYTPLFSAFSSSTTPASSSGSSVLPRYLCSLFETVQPCLINIQFIYFLTDSTYYANYLVCFFASSISALPVCSLYSLSNASRGTMPFPISSAMTIVSLFSLQIA